MTLEEARADLDRKLIQLKLAKQALDSQKSGLGQVDPLLAFVVESQVTCIRAILGLLPLPSWKAADEVPVVCLDKNDQSPAQMRQDAPKTDDLDQSKG